MFSVDRCGRLVRIAHRKDANLHASSGNFVFACPCKQSARHLFSHLQRNHESTFYKISFRERSCVVVRNLDTHAGSGTQSSPAHSHRPDILCPWSQITASLKRSTCARRLRKRREQRGGGSVLDVQFHEAIFANIEILNVNLNDTSEGLVSDLNLKIANGNRFRARVHELRCRSCDLDRKSVFKASGRVRSRRIGSEPSSGDPNKPSD